MSDAREPDAAAATRASTPSSRARCAPGARPATPIRARCVSPGRRHRQPDRPPRRLLRCCRPRGTPTRSRRCSASDARVGGSASRGGSFATLYLAPFNYHRMHMPLGRARCAPPGTCPGGSSASTPPPRRPCRACSRATSAWSARSRTGALSFALVLVGALFVGSMATVWHGEVTPRQPAPRRSELPLDGAARAAAARARRGAGPLQHGLDRHPAAAAGRGSWLPRLGAGQRRCASARRLRARST